MKKDERLCRSEDQGGQLRGKEAVTMGALTDFFESSLRLEDQSEQQLVPRLPNELVLHLIVPKLPWRAFHSLLAVSRPWRRVIRSRQVHDVRVRSHSTDTLFAFNHIIDGHIGAISLYSMRDDSWHQLPPLPQCPRGLPENCECVTLDGKLYLIGGFIDHSRRMQGTREVYVLDLVEHREWKQCASMQERRTRFASGVAGRKIFAFGGTSSSNSRSEMYDPKENVWCSISPMYAKLVDQSVLTVGDEMFLWGGMNLRDMYPFPRNANGVDTVTDHPDAVMQGFLVEVYHPGKDEWRLVKPFVWRDTAVYFMAEGELLGMTPSGIRVYDIKSGGTSWTNLHSWLFPGIEPTEHGLFQVLKTCAGNGELLALVDWFISDSRTEVRLLKSKGFRGENANIVLENVNCPLSFRSYKPFICPIQL